MLALAARQLDSVSDGPMTDPLVSARMSRQRSRDTEPENRLRRELFRRGLRYRVNYPVPGRARRSIDIAFPGIRLAVFVDGCFWHGCPEHATWPANNGAWWRSKLERNSARDLDTNVALADAGWTVCRVWEHVDVAEAVRTIEALIASSASSGSNVGVTE